MNLFDYFIGLKHRWFTVCFGILAFNIIVILKFTYPESVLYVPLNVFKVIQQERRVANSTFVTNSTEMAKLELELAQNEARRLNQMFEDYAKLFHVSKVSCSNVFAGAKHDIDLGIRLAKEMKANVSLLSNAFYAKQTVANCQTFIDSRGYITSHLTEEERDFPIAYSMLVFKDAEMVDRLLRSIYRPQNSYCIHVDAKSEKSFHDAIKGIAQCFPNVFLASPQIDVVWGHYSVLEPEIVCMAQLLSRSKKWKYFINLTGQEFPLKTNAELVKILTAYDGANDIEGTIQRANKNRWNPKPVPQGISPTKGSVHICANRKFVDYVIHNKTAAIFLNWTSRTEIPDETFFSSLNHNPQLGIPGTYLGLPETDTTNRKPFLTRYKNWGGYPFKFPCAGWWNRGICILSTGDLPLLYKRPEMFANKFYLTDDRIAIGCLEEKHFNDTRDEYFGIKSFNTTYYENLDFVTNKLPVWTS